MWTTTADGARHCERHDQTFSALEVCSSCGVDPGAPIDVVDDADAEPAPTGCVDTHEHERRFTELAIYAEEQARSEKIAKSPNESVKLIAEATKARRAAAQLASNREQLSLLKKLDRRRAELNRGRH